MKFILSALLLLCSMSIFASPTPTFEEWMRDGKKIPRGMVFTGGSPWFNESTGKNRSPEEVYKIVFGKDAKAEKKKPVVPTFDEWVKNGKKIPEGMMFPGGSAWFNESTGKNRAPEEVYKMIFKTDPHPKKGKEKEIQQIKDEIAKLKEFATRARFTREGLAKHNAKIKKLEDRLAILTKKPKA